MSILKKILISVRSRGIELYHRLNTPPNIPWGVCLIYGYTNLIPPTLRVQDDFIVNNNFFFVKVCKKITRLQYDLRTLMLLSMLSSTVLIFFIQEKKVKIHPYFTTFLNVVWLYYFRLKLVHGFDCRAK